MTERLSDKATAGRAWRLGAEVGAGKRLSDGVVVVVGKLQLRQQRRLEEPDVGRPTRTILHGGE